MTESLKFNNGVMKSWIAEDFSASAGNLYPKTSYKTISSSYNVYLTLKTIYHPKWNISWQRSVCSLICISKNRCFVFEMLLFFYIFLVKLLMYRSCPVCFFFFQKIIIMNNVFIFKCRFVSHWVFNHPVMRQDGHSFCLDCITQWHVNHTTCPVDRSI